MITKLANTMIALLQYSYEMDTLAYDIWNITSEDEGSKTLVDLSNRSYNNRS
jgi:hypothetical protein